MTTELQQEQAFWDKADADLTRRVGWSSIPTFNLEPVRQVTGGHHDLISYLKRLVPPGHRALTLACGDMLGEYPYFEHLGAAKVDAYEISEQSFARFRERVENPAMGVEFRKQDVNELDLPKNTYAFVICSHAFHHFTRIEHIATQVHDALTEDGVFLLIDYIGRNRLQFSPRQLAVAEPLFQSLPEYYRADHTGTPRPSILRVDPKALSPCEAVRSQETLGVMRSTFTLESGIVHAGILYPLFDGVAQNFDESREWDRWFIRAMWDLDRSLCSQGVIEPNFCMLVMQRKSNGARSLRSTAAWANLCSMRQTPETPLLANAPAPRGSLLKRLPVPNSWRAPLRRLLSRVVKRKRNLSPRQAPRLPGACHTGSSWQGLFNRPLIDLGLSADERLSGIFSPGYNLSAVRQSVQAQFLDDAQNYVERYQNPDYFKMLISQAFQRLDLHKGKRRQQTILDLGSGAGNSIFPLLELCKNPLLIASDFSVEMLVLLKKELVRRQLDDQCVLMQLDAQDLDFAPRSFDLIVGAAVLHHLHHPERTLQGCARLLKPGRYAIFFEPFENGHSILSLAYRSMLDRCQKEIPKRIRTTLEAYVYDIQFRKGRDKSDPRYHQLDDKWLFTRNYFEEHSAKYQFSDCVIYPLHPVGRQLEIATETILQKALGMEPDALPKSAWEVVRQYEQSFSDDLKTDMLTEGCVILKK